MNQQNDICQYDAVDGAEVDLPVTTWRTASQNIGRDQNIPDLISRPNDAVYSEISEYMALSPVTRSWEVPREKVTIEKVIGTGAFGQVAKATVKDIYRAADQTTVAVKMLKGTKYAIYKAEAVIESYSPGQKSLTVQLQTQIIRQVLSDM